MIYFRTIRLLSILLLCIGVASCGKNEDQEVAKVAVVQDAHMYVMPPGQHMAAVYLRLKNPTEKVLTVNYVSTSIAGNVEVHRTVYEGGMMQMRAVKHLKVPANSSLNFAPGEHHLMLFDVSEPPELGGSFPMTIEFNQGQLATFDVLVRKRT